MSEADATVPRLDVRPGLRISAWFLAGMALASVAAWLLLPAGAPIAVHWGIDGAPDRLAPKAEALLAMPLSAAVSAGIFAGVPFLEPRSGNLARGKRLYDRIWIGSLLLLALCHGTILAVAFGLPLDVPRVVAAGTGLFVAAIGDALAKSRANFMTGVRTPWTLSSDLAWEMSHRWTGRLLVASGLAAALAVLAPAPSLAIAVLVVGTLGSLAVGAVLSYVYWRRDPERNAGR